MQKPRHIAILGSTGSIGTQALEVVAAHPENFVVEVLSCYSQADLLIQQAIKFVPNVVVIGREDLRDQVAAALVNLPIKVYSGAKALESVVTIEAIDVVLTAMVGSVGLLPTIAAIKAKKHIALANKETLVVAGSLVTKLAADYRVDILPVDSEHSAIFQCLAGEWQNPIEKIILTASGGPFRGKTKNELAQVTLQQALKHPNWSMGAKITIDSASMMNKGLEVIEAKWLFGLRADQIDVVVHPQSIIHSLVQFEDSSIKAQLGLPDMRLPIQYALGFPNRLKADFPRFSFANFPTLNFEQPDLDTFRNLDLAFEALKKGGNSPCIINAANEIAVEAFLKEKISFLAISDTIEKAFSTIDFIENPNLEDLLQTDEYSRIYTRQLLNL